MIDWSSFILGAVAAIGLLCAGAWIAVLLLDLKEWIERRRKKEEASER